MKRTVQVVARFGGERHSGWLPDGASVPPDTEDAVVRLEVTLRDDDDGYLLIWTPAHGEPVDANPPYAGDLWFEDEASAIQSARENFGVEW